RPGVVAVQGKMDAGCADLMRLRGRRRQQRRGDQQSLQYGRHGRTGVSKVSDAHRLSQSASEKNDALTMCTDLTSQTPRRGNSNENAPCALLRVVSRADASFCGIATTSASGSAFPS